MHRFFILAVLTMILITCGCGRKLIATVQADASYPVPAGLSWVAVPGPGMEPAPSSATSATPAKSEPSGLARVAASLSGTLTLYNWTWISDPSTADVLVRIWWETSGPEYLMNDTTPYYDDPFYRNTSFGFGLGAGWRHRGFRTRRGSLFDSRARYSSSSIQTVYVHTLIIEALRSSALPPAIRTALSSVPAAPSPAHKDIPSTSAAPSSAQKDTHTATDPNPPYAPPILNAESIPSEAVLWRVVVTSTGSRNNIQDILPQLTAAALPLAGKNAEINVVVDSELQVTYQ